MLVIPLGADVAASHPQIARFPAIDTRFAPRGDLPPPSTSSRPATAEFPSLVRAARGDRHASSPARGLSSPSVRATRSMASHGGGFVPTAMRASGAPLYDHVQPIKLRSTSPPPPGNSRTRRRSPCHQLADHGSACSTWCRIFVRLSKRERLLTSRPALPAPELRWLMRLPSTWWYVVASCRILAIWHFCRMVFPC